ncbi:MAG TPA: hypothetical protein DCY88_18250 [Cyanobacteria bacterium UBA11372]|nr:hypothetical protein [Cyanobacteria bacterium UBA11372]
MTNFLHLKIIKTPHLSSRAFIDALHPPKADRIFHFLNLDQELEEKRANLPLVNPRAWERAK